MAKAPTTTKTATDSGSAAGAEPAAQTDAAGAAAETTKPADDAKATTEPAPAVPAGMVRLVRAAGSTVASVSWGGNSYVVDDKGEVLVPVVALADLRSHGFEMKG